MAQPATDADILKRTAEPLGDRQQFGQPLVQHPGQQRSCILWLGVMDTNYYLLGQS